MTNCMSAALFVPILQPSEHSWCTSVLCECRMFGVCEKCCSAWFILLQLMPGKKKKKPQHNTSIENNSLLLGLCTYISFVCLFFCLSRYPGGIIRSLHAETHQLWHYILWFLSISHTCQCTGFVPYYFQVSKAAPISKPGSQAQPWRGQRGRAVGSGSEAEHGPFDSSSLGEKADADTISMYLHTGISVKSGDEILVPLASGIKLSLTPLGPGFYSWYEFSLSDNLKMLLWGKESHHLKYHVCNSGNLWHMF